MPDIQSGAPATTRSLGHHRMGGRPPDDLRLDAAFNRTEMSRLVSKNGFDIREIA